MLPRYIAIYVLLALGLVLIYYQYSASIINTISSVRSHTAWLRERGSLCSCGNETFGDPNTMEAVNLTGRGKIPNIVHYTWYASKETPMTFQHYLGVLSAHKVLKPDKIYIHMNVDRAEGEYWDKIVALNTVEPIKDGLPTEVCGKQIIGEKTVYGYIENSNLGRLKHLQKYGGIYLDYDVLVIQPFDELRKYHDFVLGQESRTQICGGIILSTKDSLFLCLWVNEFVNEYRPERWGYMSGRKPADLWRKYPNLLHTEETKLNRPNWNELVKIWGNKTFNWRENYALHTWNVARKYKEEYKDIQPNETNIMEMNNTYGEVARYILSL